MNRDELPILSKREFRIVYIGILIIAILIFVAYISAVIGFAILLEKLDKKEEDNYAIETTDIKYADGTENYLYHIHNLETKYDSKIINIFYSDVKLTTIVPASLFEEGIVEPIMSSRILQITDVSIGEEETYYLSDTASIYDVTEYDDGGYRIITVDDIYPYIEDLNLYDKYRTNIYYSDNGVIYGIVFYRYEERN